jgi:hypothetical protein
MVAEGRMVKVVKMLTKRRKNHRRNDTGSSLIFYGLNVMYFVSVKVHHLPFWVIFV